MLKQSKFKFALLLLVPFLMLGCFEDHASKFHLDDINQVEWAPPNPASSSLSYSQTLVIEQTEAVNITLQVQLIGAQTNSDRTIGVAVSETNGEEDVQFELLTSTVVIPANSNHGEAEFQILSENIGNGREFSFQLELQATDDLDVAVNMKDMNVNVAKNSVEFDTEFEGVDETDPQGSSTLEGFSRPDEFIAELTVRNFPSESTFNWQVHSGVCADGEDVVGDALDYPSFDTNVNGAGSAEAEVEVRIFQTDQFHLRIQDDTNQEIVCSDYES